MGVSGTFLAAASAVTLAALGLVALAPRGATATTPEESGRKSKCARLADPKEFVSCYVQSHDVLIFSKSYCGFSRRAKGEMRELVQDKFTVAEQVRKAG
mmetsp:Transcript_19790/g.62957  ORF Transcript_19790/g.62957 Transcript_19790/m.62957 type:complete len:99 (+) Transcript_19790:66-362(+)